MNDKDPSTTPSVSSHNKLDPIAVLREELAAAALCHGVERVDGLTEALIGRVVQRLGGVQVYVPLRRVLPREQLKAEVCERFNGCNARELAWRYGISLRQVQRLLASTKD